MASVIKVFGDNGGSDGSPGSNRDLSGGGTKIRFRSDDDWHTIDGTNPVPIPTAGSNYSYWVHLYLKCTSHPGAEVVNNIKFYTDGSGYGTGITLHVGDQFPTNNSGAAGSGYELATGNPGTTGDELAAGHTGISSKSDAFSKTSIAPLSGPSISEGSASGVIDAVGDMSDYLLLQATIGTSATSGVKTAETLTFRYDETG